MILIKSGATVDYDDEVKFPSKEEVIIQKLTESDLQQKKKELETQKVASEMSQREKRVS